MSFGDDPDKVFFMLTASDRLGNINFGGKLKNQEGIDNLFSATAAGLYFVPPGMKGDYFLGNNLFPYEFV